MKTFKIVFDLKSSIRTPFHADTIFGHFCWALRFLFGNDYLKAWLKDFPDNPTLFSNAFEWGSFPKPVLPMPRLRIPGMDPIQQSYVLKKIKKRTSVSEDWIVQNKDQLSSRRLFQYLSQEIISGKVGQIQKAELPVLRNTHNRLTGRVLEMNGLYETEELFYADQKSPAPRFWFLIKSSTLDHQTITRVMDYLQYTGYGADKSIGKGQIALKSVEEYNLWSCNNPNAFISLSNFVPARAEELNGFYNLITKFGKLGELWASGYLPFKKPVIMLQAGSIIFDTDFNENKIYGKLQSGIHTTNPDIVQYGYAFPMPVHLEESNDV